MVPLSQTQEVITSTLEVMKPVEIEWSAEGLRDLRVRRGYNQDDLSKASGVALNSIRKCESTKKPANPTVDTLVSLGRALNAVFIIDYRKVKSPSEAEA